MPSSEKATILTTKLKLRPDVAYDFAEWQAKLNAGIAIFPGFISLEILSPIETVQPFWVIVQRFDSFDNLSAWRSSQESKNLREELKKFLVDSSLNPVEEVESSASNTQSNVTEVFVTQVSPDKENAYRKWTAKIHQIEAKFPGFRGVYVQSPNPGQGRNWITLLQFDTLENLDRWLTSPERAEVLREGTSLISSLENHRVISPYAGWFASLAKEGEVPSVWKQTMLVLLVLFPIVMLELKYLSPLTAHLNSSIATFIGNAISVTLIAWPMMPIAIWFLSWWLSPKSSHWVTFLGTLLILILYGIEIAVFWNLL